MTTNLDLPRRSERPQFLVDHPSGTGEGPLWDERTGTVTWNDIPAGHLFRYDPADGSNTLLYEHDAMIGGHTLQEDGSIILFCSDGRIAHLDPKGETSVIVEQIDAVNGSRFNDVIADPAGRVLCGTMPLEHGPAHLYRLDTDGSLHLVWDDLGLSNGMGFGPDEKTFYLSDSDHGVIYRADYDKTTGELANREVLIRLEDDGAVPDGMTVDAHGDLWLAVWDGACLLHFAADGSPIDKVEFPVQKVSSLNFGGPDYDFAYVTTAGGNERSEAEGVLAGSLFGIALENVTGKPDYHSRIETTAP